MRPPRLATSGSDNASLTDASNLIIASATIGGDLTLSGGGTIGQSGAIQSHALNVTTTHGAITPHEQRQRFTPSPRSRPGGTDDASLYDAANLTVAGATIGGTLNLTGGGSIGQSGAIHATTLNVTTTGGAITLIDAGNAFGTASLTTAGSDNATLYDASAPHDSGANVGGTLTLAGGSTIGQTGAIHAAALNVSTIDGAITLTNSGNSFAIATLSTAGSDNTSLTDASNLTIASANIGGALTLDGAGGIGQTDRRGRSTRPR